MGQPAYRTPTSEPAALAQLIDHSHLCSFPRQLAGYLATLCRFDNCLMLLYPCHQPPRLLYHNAEQISPAMALYLQQDYRLDPLVDAMAQRRADGVSRLSTLTNDAFTRSEYYRHCYRAFELVDEINLVVTLADSHQLAITLGRKASLGSIRRGELNRLQQQYPVIAALLHQFWLSNREQWLPQRRVKPLELALRSFGQGILTPREQQIVTLLLQGHSTDAIARQLGISPGTVKVHRKNIHSRLDTSSQSEIFTRFLSHLSAMKLSTTGPDD